MAMRTCIAFVATIVAVGANVVVHKKQIPEVSPVQQVVNLMKELVTRVEGEGKKEAEEYDKYACFCKDEADDKYYAISLSNKKLEKLKAQVEELDTRLATNNKDIAELAKLISHLKQDIIDSTDKRTQDHSDYSHLDMKMKNSIQDIEGAIKTIKKARPSDFLQVREMASRVLQNAKEQPKVVSSEVTKDLLNNLAMIGDPGKPHGYEFHSEGIIGTLTDLRKTFIENKNDLDSEEFDAQTAHDEKMLNHKHTIKVSEHTKAGKETQVENDTADVEAKRQVIDEETEAKDADVKFIQKLQTDCEHRAHEFDQRSATRSNELIALNKAIETLMSGVVPAYSGVAVAALQSSASPRRALAFLQVRQEKPLQKVLDVLSQRAKSLQSSALTEIAVKIGLSGDHFGKVRNLIGDLIDRLIKDQQRDETMKAYCDQQLTETAAIRDQAQMAVEEAEAKESFIISEIARLTKMIEEDQANIAKNKKAVDEMTTLRNGEHADNMQTIEVAKGGEKAVDFAIQVLQEFYENGGGVAEMGSNPEFIQIHQDPEDADREGNSVASLAPNEAQGTYKGSQLRGGLVIELLQTIKEDFYDTENSAKEGEDAAVKDYNSDKSGLDIEVENLRKEIATELSNQNDDNSVLAETKQDIKDHKSEAADATEAAERMQALCSKGQSTLKDKEAAREKEIAALKEAIDLLNGLEKN